jgi:hypothetical protein
MANVPPGAGRRCRGNAVVGVGSGACVWAESMSSSEQDQKVAKKLAKAAAKAAKKRASAGLPPAPETSSPAWGRTPAERAADAAERQVRLQHLRIIVAALAVLVALITLLVTMWR